MSVKRVRELVEKLSNHCADVVESAAGFAMARTHYELTIEHIVIKLLEDGSGDLAHILRAYNIDTDSLWHGMLQYLSTIRAGNSGKPSFSPFVIDWFEQAWINASLHYRHEEIRSGDLLDALVEMAPRLPGGHLALLDNIPIDDLRTKYRELTQASVEGRSTRKDKGVQSASGRRGKAGQRRTQERESTEQGALAQFTIDVTGRARAGEIDPVFGRDNEIRQMVDVLSRRRKNNPILVGEPGVGKTALVEGLALRMVEGKVPDELKEVALHILDLGLLQAGAGVKGEFENRLKQVIEEVKSSGTPIILFIDEAHTLIGAGGEAGGSDAANLLKPALARGELRTIAATTWSEYKQYFERDAALARRFQLVKVEEPDVDNAITMLAGLKAFYQRHHNVLITDDAIRAAVQLSDRYITGRQLPDKAIDLIDTASARVRMGQASPPQEVESAESELNHIDRRLDQLQEERNHGLKVDQKTVVELESRKKQLQEQLAETRLQWQIELAMVKKLGVQREQYLNGEISASENQGNLKNTDFSSSLNEEEIESLVQAREEIQGAQGKTALVHSEVTADVVAQVISDWTGIPAGRMVHDVGAMLLELEDHMMSRVIGQGQAISKIGKALRTRTAGLTRTDAPMGVFLLVGPSGIGKTETARAIADLLFGGERFLVTINMSEYQEAHTVSQLKGSPPGYVGYGEGGILTEAVRQRPYSVVLLDEVEKAHPDVMNLFFQVFDRGFMRDGEGRDIDFTNTVILMTSNLASTEIMSIWEQMSAPEENETGGQVEDEIDVQPSEEAGVPDKELNIEKVEQDIQPQLLEFFPQALLARMQVIPYLPLDRDALRNIVALKLDRVAQRIKEAHDMEMQCDHPVIDHLARLCQRPELGARHIDAIIDRQLLPNVARTLLNYMIEDQMPDILRIALDENRQLVCDFLDRISGDEEPVKNGDETENATKEEDLVSA